MNSLFKMMNSVLKLMNSLLKMMNSVLKLMNCVLKTDPLLHRQSCAPSLALHGKNHHFQGKNHRLYIKMYRARRCTVKSSSEKQYKPHKVAVKTAQAARNSNEKQYKTAVKTAVKSHLALHGSALSSSLHTSRSPHLQSERGLSIAGMYIQSRQPIQHVTISTPTRCRDGRETEWRLSRPRSGDVQLQPVDLRGYTCNQREIYQAPACIYKPDREIYQSLACIYTQQQTSTRTQKLRPQQRRPGLRRSALLDCDWAHM